VPIEPQNLKRELRILMSKAEKVALSYLMTPHAFLYCSKIRSNGEKLRRFKTWLLPTSHFLRFEPNYTGILFRGVLKNLWPCKISW